MPRTTEPFHSSAPPTKASHILFTSGSTGVPKGVVITHSNVTTFVAWALKHYEIDHTDRFSGHTPFHFDLSTFDIFGAITAGAQLHLVPPETALLPPKLAEFIRDSELTQWFSVPSVLELLGEIQCRTPERLPFTSQSAMVWRSAANTRAHVLDGAPPQSSLLESLRPHRGDHRQQLL